VSGKKLNIGGALLLAVLGLQAVRAESARDWVRRGNRLYEAGDFTGAIDRYEQALLEKADAVEAKFNKANSYYRLDDLAGAMDLYRQAAAESKDMNLVAKARYNLGNCHFQEGMKQRDSNLEKAMEGLQSSIVHWREVLEIEPENERAAKNIEVARLIIKDIIDQINKERQQQQEQAEQQKQLQQKLEQLLERQKALGEKTKETHGQADKGDISQEQATQEYAEQAVEQSQVKQDTEEVSRELRSQDPNAGPQPQMEQAVDELDQASASQAEAGRQLDASNGAKAKEAEDGAAEHIEKALKSLLEGGRQNQQQQSPQRPEGRQEPNDIRDPNEAEGQQAEEEQAAAPDTTADDILDKEQQQREQRQRMRRGSYRKVEKDW
jgi:hypothetical protein